ncbi:hypothetical protein QJS10_CPB14g01290 [Acorus calamus]|uniref:Uncharacterized protein n=1 Tax=Acorus calamus TaxID=4465 RepID=A0AAV9DF21_ACOCL|nr:hypothetical protein QJS10_CPB14g01290 [Acorus calamus]
MEEGPQEETERKGDREDLFAKVQDRGPQYRAVKTRKHRFQSLPDSYCLKTLSCPVTTLYTAENKSTAEGLIRTIIASTFPVTKEDLSDIVSLSYLVFLISLVYEKQNNDEDTWAQ